MMLTARREEGGTGRISGGATTNDARPHEGRLNATERRTDERMTDDGARKTSGRDVAAGRTLERVRSASATARGWIAKTRRRDARVGTTGWRPCGASCAVIARWTVTRAASLQWHCTAASSSAAMQLRARDWRKHYFRRRHIAARGERATRRRRRPTDGRAPRPRLDAPRIASSAPRRIAAMVLYDMFIAVKSTVPRSQMADVLRKMGHRVLDAGGVITDITSFGTQTLAYQIRKQGQGHLEVRVVGSLGASNRRVARSRVVSARASIPNRIERPRFIVSREQNPTYVVAVRRVPPTARSPSSSANPPARDSQANYMQMSFNAKPEVIDVITYDLRTDERILRFLPKKVNKGRPLRSLKEYKARDSRNPTNLQAMAAEDDE